MSNTFEKSGQISSNKSINESKCERSDKKITGKTEWYTGCWISEPQPRLMSHHDLGCIFVLFITQNTETTHILNAKMSGSSLKKHSKGIQAQDTQVKIQFSLLHPLGLSITVEGNFVADSKLIQPSWCAGCTLISFRELTFLCHSEPHTQIHCTLQHFPSLS